MEWSLGTGLEEKVVGSDLLQLLLVGEWQREGEEGGEGGRERVVLYRPSMHLWLQDTLYQARGGCLCLRPRLSNEAPTPVFVPTHN